jgi:uncharacterized protein
MVKSIPHLTASEKNALEEIKRRVSDLFPIRSYIIFGSKARGDAEQDSDVDLLLITGRELTHRERHQISDILTGINLAYDTLFSFIAVDDARWNSNLYRFYPIHENIGREGIPV